MAGGVVVVYRLFAVALELPIAAERPGNQIFVLDYSVYALGKGIIGGFFAHANLHLPGPQQPQVPPIGILRAPIGVVGAAFQRFGRKLIGCHLQSCEVSLGPQVFAGRPANNSARIHVDNKGQIVKPIADL